MSEPWLQAELQAEPPAKRPVYVCLDASDGDIERRILGHSCEVRMLNATCAAELRSEDLDAADVVAPWAAPSVGINHRSTAGVGYLQAPLPRSNRTRFPCFLNR